MSLYISKSGYCNAVQCPKMLWMSKREEYHDKFDDFVMNEGIFQAGNKVNDLAMELFGDAGEINKGTTIKTKASFSYNGMFCNVDVLKKNGNGSYEIYEVKSSTGIKPVYYDETAYQYYIMTKLGYEVTKVSIVYINSHYVRYGELDLQQLFSFEDVTDIVREKFPDVDDNVTRLEEYMNAEEEPDQEIGQYCFSPYKCGFFKYCSQDLPSPNIFDVVDMQLRTKFKYFDEGLVSFKDLYKNGNLNGKHLLQVEHELYDVEDKIDKNIIRDFIDSLTYPLYFIDFETSQEAVPEYDGCKPYEQMPFQYSLHILHENGELEHKEFLAEAGRDPRRLFAERLCEDVPNGVCSVSYNMEFEKGRIRKLRELYPDLSNDLTDICDNMYDLMPVFKKNAYYKKEMEGSYSIKKVLPALFPDDPELDYKNLPGINKGDQAANAFREMKNASPEEVARIREELLAYCRLDTLAMVKIWMKLNEVIKQ